MPRNLRKRPRPDFVLDVSVAVPWVIRALWSDYPSQVLNARIRNLPIISESWWADLLAAVLEAENRGWGSPVDTVRHLAAVESLPVLIDAGGMPGCRAEVANLARDHALPVPQATALELALRSRLPLATIDTRLRTAATRAGVALFAP